MAATAQPANSPTIPATQFRGPEQGPEQIHRGTSPDLNHPRRYGPPGRGNDPRPSLPRTAWAEDARRESRNTAFHPAAYLHDQGRFHYDTFRTEYDRRRHREPSPETAYSRYRFDLREATHGAALERDPREWDDPYTQRPPQQHRDRAPRPPSPPVFGRPSLTKENFPGVEGSDISKSLYYFEVHSYQLGLTDAEKYLAAVQFLPRGEIKRFLDDLGLGRRGNFEDLKDYLLATTEPAYPSHKFRGYYNHSRTFRDLVERAKEMARDPPDELMKVFFALLCPSQLQEKAMCALKYNKRKFLELMELNLDEYRASSARPSSQGPRHNPKDPKPRRVESALEGNETFRKDADLAGPPPLCGPHKRWGAEAFSCYKGNCSMQHLIKQPSSNLDPQHQGN